MTAAQRKKINKRNAQKSTGPKTQAGKEHARRNALKHGLCASKLTLIGEYEHELKQQHREWVDTHQPQTPAEVILVDQAVFATIRLKRAARAEAARQTVEAYHAYTRLEEEREDKLEELKALLPKEPALVARQLRRFGLGCRWMIERWRLIERSICDKGSAQTDFAKEAVRLLGGDPERPKQGPSRAYTFRLWNVACAPVENEELLGWLCNDNQAHEDHFVLHGENVPDPTPARELLLNLIRMETEDLERRSERYRELERLEFDEALADSRIPSDTPKTRLWMRYQAAATSSFHRALSTLMRLQKDRRAAEEEEERNEANGGPEPTVSADPSKDCAEEPVAVSGDPIPQSSPEVSEPWFEEWPASLDASPVAPVVPPLTADDESA